MASVENSHSSRSSLASTSSVASQATTSIVFDHEPWAVTEPRVHELCRQLWPSETGTFPVEEMQGGEFHRIIGVQTPSSDRFILRIQRFETAQQKREMTNLRYARQQTSIPTAQIVFFDHTPENPLEMPYVVLTRVSGQDLRAMYRTLSHEHRLTIAEQWGKLPLSLRSVLNGFAGIIDTLTDGNDSSDAQVYKSVLDMFILQFERWIAADKRHPSPHSSDHLPRLMTVAREMDAAGLLSDDVFFSLCHCNLWPWNVMADIDQTNNVLQITGVLDWDSACFAPHFVNCEPPSWIWVPSDAAFDIYCDEEDDEPATEEAQQLKLRFEQAVGQDMLKFFYTPQYRLARDLFKLVMGGLWGNPPDLYAMIEGLIQEWELLQRKPLSPLLPEHFKTRISIESPYLTWASSMPLPTVSGGTAYEGPEAEC